jgi:hypothetical protein
MRARQMEELCERAGGKRAVVDKILEIMGFHRVRTISLRFMVRYSSAVPVANCELSLAWGKMRDHERSNGPD